MKLGIGQLENYLILFIIQNHSNQMPNNNKIGSLFTQNPETSDLVYSEKADKSEYENTDNEELSSIKFGITSEELDAFSHGYNLQFFEKKNFKYKAKKLCSYIKNEEIRCHFKIRSLIFFICSFIFCLVLFLFLTNSLSHPKTALYGQQLIQVPPQSQKQQIKKEQITVPSTRQYKQIMIKKSQQTGSEKQQQKEAQISKDKKFHEVTIQPKAQIQQQKNKQQNSANPKPVQQKSLNMNDGNKQTKNSKEKVLPANVGTNKIQTEQKKIPVEKKEIDSQKSKTRKDMKGAKVEGKEKEKLETMKIVKSVNEVKVSNPVNERVKNIKRLPAK